MHLCRGWYSWARQVAHEVTDTLDIYMLRACVRVCARACVRACVRVCDTVCVVNVWLMCGNAHLHTLCHAIVVSCLYVQYHIWGAANRCTGPELWSKASSRRKCQVLNACPK